MSVKLETDAQYPDDDENDLMVSMPTRSSFQPLGGCTPAAFGMTRTIAVCSGITLMLCLQVAILSKGDSGQGDSHNSCLTSMAGCTLSCSAPLATQLLQDRVNAANITTHLNQLLAIARESDGHRSVGTIGYNRSIAYVKSQLEAYTSFRVSEETFTHSAKKELQPPKLGITLASNKMTWLDGGQFSKMTGSGSGEVTAQTLHAGLGCNSSCFSGSNFSGKIAIIQRGECLFWDKASSAEAAGAVAAIVYNTGEDGAHMKAFNGYASAPNSSVSDVKIPLVSVPYLTGELLADNVTVSVFTYESEPHVLYTSNLCAETAQHLHGGQEDSTVVVGAHLDSVPAGPGINDNGSGSMMILEIALQLAQYLRISPKPKPLANRVRFCWWGAEEVGLKGSAHYVNHLNRTNPQELERIALALNFDMVGSPNFIRGVYNGTQGYKYGELEGTPAADYVGHASEKITELFISYFNGQGLPYELTDFNGRSDYGPFLDYGIPAGGLDSGADGKKTEEERRLYGGMVGVQHDPCYHLACDTVDNVSPLLLGQMGPAAAHAIERMSAAPQLRGWLSGAVQFPLPEGLHNSDAPAPASGDDER